MAVHPVRVESQVVPDGRHRVVGSLVGPDGVDGVLPASGRMCVISTLYQNGLGIEVVVSTQWYSTVTFLLST
jgi:hypothetical protein